jgi:hypothetical protein
MMQRRWLRYRVGLLLGLMVGLVVGPTGCASASGGGARSGSRDVLDASEIEAAGGQIRTAMDAVEQLRPHFLRTRANATMGVTTRLVDPIVVYVDGVRRGGTPELARIPAEQVLRIRYVRPSDAQTRYGLDHGSGVIEVELHGG